MPSFDLTGPLTLTLEFDVGTARIGAGERSTAVVEVLPADGADDADVRAAQQTAVTCADGVLLVKGPRKRGLFGKSGSLDISVELPAGSEVRATSPMAGITCEGRLGECRIKTSLGDIRVEEAAGAHLRTDHGDIRVDHVTGDAEITGAGRIDAGEITGAATVKNGNGETTITTVGGELRVNAANGRITVGTARSGIDAKSANGGIRVGEVSRGRVVLQTAVGDIEVGVREPVAAWLDVNTRFGSVRNAISPSDGPGDSGESVEVRARTGVGDIVITRTQPSTTLEKHV
ncbi:DUF4097 family beta strand repeat-containing protein [Streptomyces sp. SL13]|uniref:DUF4097 family beta strand repeat-containing protein n=1 Tax=Streptantibioticus silvisoli TaxID=2705255 RepID=A0AA90HFS7_9ACTN|nr:DUF4097 family beta strand repeat-containing protein [Streptantibioticus silvisoli]MDI5974137.1 DUF4097 family beta strand repeat-containing protein [Streptantibioticus silvisoli]